EGSLPGAFAQTDLAAAAFGVAGAAVSELLEAGGAPTSAVEVDRVLSSGWFLLPPGPSRLLNPPPRPFHFPAFHTEIATTDGRWLRLHGFPANRERVVKALGVEDDIDAVAAVVRERAADEIEQELVDVGCVVAASRTPEEWFAHPAGAAVDAEPLAAVTEFAAEGSGWRPTPGRPLSGIKVLDHRVRRGGQWVATHAGPPALGHQGARS
ncbi:hypothetical protein AB4Z54_53845, partial [Streptomyces sp. MCAF7]